MDKPVYNLWETLLRKIMSFRGIFRLGLTAVLTVGYAVNTNLERRNSNMSSSTGSKKTLAEELEELIYASAEYSHPLDADARDLKKAAGHVTIQELKELLERHSEKS